MNFVNDFLLNYYFLSFAIAWILSVILKIIIDSIQEKSLNTKVGFSNGGMPSSHTAFSTALTFALLFKTGFSEYFFIAVVFTAIIISDAFNVRYNLGIQGDNLNLLLKKAGEKEIKVVHGHTFAQVVVGFILGIIVSYILFIIV